MWTMLPRQTRSCECYVVALILDLASGVLWSTHRLLILSKESSANGVAFSVPRELGSCSDYETETPLDVV